jgi:hypothetical protein
MTRFLWIALVIAAFADSITFCGIDPRIVAVQELNPLARAIGPNLLAGIVTKTILLGLFVMEARFNRWCGAPRWLTPAVLAFGAILCTVGAETNLIFGHAWGLA